MHEMKPNVVRLPCHLPEEQQVYIGENEDPQEAVDRKSITELIAWMKLNQRDSKARQYLYIDIPQHYVFDQKEKEYKERKYMPFNNCKIQNGGWKIG